MSDLLTREQIDQERADIMLNGIKGKRLTYKRTAKQQVS